MPSDPSSPRGPNENGASSAAAGHTATFEDLQAKIADDVTATKEAVKHGSDTAMQKVQETVAEQTGFAARQVTGIATALQKVGAELENGEQAEVGRYARQIGASLQAIAKDMEGKDIGALAGMAEDFGRKQPLAFLGAAALAGLTASRFLTASAKRKALSETDPTARSSGRKAGSQDLTEGSIDG